MGQWSHLESQTHQICRPLYHRFDFESATHMESQTQQSSSDARYTVGSILKQLLLVVGSILHLYVDLIFISKITLLMSLIAMEFISPLSSPSRLGLAYT